MSGNTDEWPSNFSNSALVSHLVLGNSWDESLLPLMLLEINSLRLYYMSCSVHLPMYSWFLCYGNSHDRSMIDSFPLLSLCVASKWQQFVLRTAWLYCYKGQC